MATDVTLPEDLLGVTMQLSAAFGQGAGTMLMERQALLPAFRTYEADLRRVLPEWDTYSLQTVNLLRAMGAFAAKRALDQGRFVIIADDVEEALGLATGIHRMPLAACRITG